jgi:sterol desaturase/sphingolipid hydroxylase (fatty acid hydroxylase superfamily)
MSLSLTVAVVATAALLLFLTERAVPLRAQRYPWVREVSINLALSVLAFAVSAVLVRPAVLRTMGWSRGQHLGLVYLMEMPPWVRSLLVFLLLDLSFYYWHRLNHEWPALWRFHNVHHCDPDLGVSTSFRFHFVEVALSTVFRVVQVSVIGASLSTYAAYEVVFQLSTLFHHSNVRLPIRLERLLNRILVTPRMHGIHHSQVRDETSSNYSVALSWWDRLHRTLRLNVPQARIVIGVPGYSAPEDNQLRRLLSMPFRQQRDYWVGPDGEKVQREPEELGSNLYRLEE